MIFSYWTSGGGTYETWSPEKIPAVSAWKESFPDYQVYTDADVLPCMKRLVPEYVALYNRIRIPACRSDIARLLLLHEFGGLYVDAHVGPGNGNRLAEIFAKLAKHELIVFDKPWERKNEGDVYIINTLIGARRGTDILPILIVSAFSNLAAHAALEAQTAEHVPYNIHSMTGAWDLGMRLFDRTRAPILLKSEYAERVNLHPLRQGADADGVELYKFYGYREPNQHWSERQKHERLLA